MNAYTSSNSDLVDKYFAALKREPQLSFEEQMELFPLAQKGNKAATEKLVRSNLRFVVTIAKGYQNRGLDFCDLIAEGNLGLYDAIKKYDTSSGYKFSTYAVNWIRMRIREAIEANNVIRVPRKANVDKSTFIASSLDEQLGDDESYTLSDSIADDSYLSADKALEEKEMIKSVRGLMRLLDERERYVVENYYGFAGEKKSCQEIGKAINRTRQMALNIKNAAINKMRTGAIACGLDAYIA